MSLAEAQSFIDTQRVQYQHIALYGTVAERFEQRQWHQLTEALSALVKDPQCSHADNFIQLYERFISAFEAKLNQLQFALILAQIAKQYYPSRPYVYAELDRASALLQPYLTDASKKSRLGADALLVLKMEAAHLTLLKATSLMEKSEQLPAAQAYFTAQRQKQLDDIAAAEAASALEDVEMADAAAKATPSDGASKKAPAGGAQGKAAKVVAKVATVRVPRDAAEAVAFLLDEGRKAVTEGKAMLDKLPPGTEPVVAAVLHRVASFYFKIRGPAHSFYAEALGFLSHTPIEALSPQERIDWAVDTTLAALVGDGVFNFGEIAQNPVIAEAFSDAAQNPHVWLRELLAAFQNGNIDAFSNAVARNQAAFDTQPALVAHVGKIKEKITLLAVMELAARKPPSDRSLSFAEIAAETRLPEDQVEWVCMRAMSLGLIRGRVDEVDRIVHVAYVKPRVLDRQQIGQLKSRVDAWQSKVHEMSVFLENGTKDVFA